MVEFVCSGTLEGGSLTLHSGDIGAKAAFWLAEEYDFAASVMSQLFARAFLRKA